MLPSTTPPRFEPTRWTLIHRLRGPEATARAALDELCRIYWWPLYCFGRQRGLQPADAEDATQEFLLGAVESDLFGRADPNLGRLRTFLLTAFGQRLLNRAAREGAAVRGGKAIFIPIDAATSEVRYLEELIENETPEKLFDRLWALTILDRVLLRLEHKWVAAEKAGWFAALKPFLGGGREGVETYANAARRMSVSADNVRIAAFRLRRSFRQELLREIAETVASDDPNVLEDELNFLISAVS